MQQAQNISKNAFYIALEGPDGAGKTTQMKLLRAAFEASGEAHIAIREPGATDVGKQIREILLTGHGDKLDGTTEALLFSADRRHTILTMVRPALAEGTHILSDRTYLTTLVFQGYGRGLPLATLNTLTDIAVETTRPQLQLILDIPPDVGLTRKGTQFTAGLNEDRFESIGSDFHRRNYEGYHAEAAKNPTYALIDANADPLTVHGRIIEAIHGKLGLKLSPSVV